jgi:hypothetical protein
VNALFIVNHNCSTQKRDPTVKRSIFMNVSRRNVLLMLPPSTVNFTICFALGCAFFMCCFSLFISRTESQVQFRAFSTSITAGSCQLFFLMKSFGASSSPDAAFLTKLYEVPPSRLRETQSNKKRGERGKGGEGKEGASVSRFKAELYVFLHRFQYNEICRTTKLFA